MKLKKRFLFSALVGVLVLTSSVGVFAQDITVYINDKKIQMDVMPEVKQNSTFVPISFIGKELGAEVKWENPNVIIRKDNSEIICTIDSNQARKDGQSIYLASAPYIKSGRTLVPLRFISQQMGYKVNFDNNNKIIYINEYGENEIIPDLSTGDTIDISEFILSPNKLWGIKKEQVYSTGYREDILYIRDHTTDSIKKLYSTNAFLKFNWLKDNTLLLSGMKDVLGGADRKHIMRYEPLTGKFTNLADADGFEYLESINSIIYFKRMATDDRDLIGSECEILNLTTGQTTIITSDQYSLYIAREFEK